MSQYSETIGSFIRTGDYPLEANYIFATEDALKAFFDDPLNKVTLHKGLLKVVEADENGKQALYWVTETDGELQFEKLITDIDIESLDTEVASLLNTLNKEIEDRKAADIELLGTDDKSTLAYDSIYDLAEALTALQDSVSKLKTQSEEADATLKKELQATVGTEETDIVEYLKTLDYPSLTKVSEALHKFLDTIDEEDNTINTLPEIQEFLKGYEYTHNLYECLQDLWDKIEGDPTPTTQFRTLRGIQDFVETLASATTNRDNNLQTELDQTQVGVGLSSDGSYSADKETHYLQDATSVMNALKTLDSLIYTAIQEYVLEPSNKDVVPLEVVKTSNGYTIGAKLSLSNTTGNQLLKKDDGLYYSTALDYEKGVITLKVNDNIIAQYDLNISSIIKDAYYDSDTEELVLVFNTLDESEQVRRIPVASLIEEWETDNTGTSQVVELTKTRVVNGSDKLSGDVRLSSNTDNILEKDGNTLLVKGTTDNLTHKGTSLETVISNLQESSEKVSSDLASEVSRATLKETELANSIALEKTRATKAEESISTEVENAKTRLTTAETSLASEITRATTKESELNTAIASEVTRATDKEELLDHRIDDVTTALETEVSRAKEAEQANADDIDSIEETLKVKADLVDGKVPLDQLSIVYWIEVE